MKVFPTRRFHFDGVDADIERQTLSGGTAISGEEDLLETDGGGRVYAAFTDPYLDEPNIALGWRACSGLLAGGSLPIIVPLGDARHQQFGDVATPPGGLPWWDETDFTSTLKDAALTAPAPLRATSLTIGATTLPAPVRPGIWLSIDHATKRHRAYRVVDVAGSTLTITPPLREVSASGTPVEFRDPKCTMRLDGTMTSPTSMGFATAQGCRFVEYPGAPS